MKNWALGLVAGLVLGACAITESDAPLVVLGDGAGLAGWTHLDGRDAEWLDLGGGAMEVAPGTGNVVTRAQFGDARVELEFMTPWMPDAVGQARGNSGVYLHGLYEVQVLDSFGVEPGLDTCGAIYNVSAASAAACLEPGVWQRYGIEFTAPQLDDEGRVTSKAALSVWLNGVLIQDEVQLDAPTGSASGSEALRMGPLMLQDHGNRVRFRNVRIYGR